MGEEFSRRMHSVRWQVDVIARYGHNGEVNRARYLPQNPRIVATKSGGDGGALLLSSRVCMCARGSEGGWIMISWYHGHR